ncbi:hypothetical protein EBQ81_01215 [bacterium]|nr:hypothetical protein [bacterium]
MNVNQKGVKGLIKVIDNLQDQGFYCFPAFDDHSPVDLIALSEDGKTYRLQIKYRGLDTTLYTSSVVNGKRVDVNRDLIDGWAVYLSTENKVVYISKQFMETRKTHKIDTTKYAYGELSEWSKDPLC